jgi:hypothetical protein
MTCYPIMIQDSPTTTVENPQANSIIECTHLTMESMIRTFIAEATENQHQILPADLDDFVDTAVTSTQRAINATIHSVTEETPGSFIYQRDMMLSIQLFANWELFHHKKGTQMTKNLFYENKDCRPFDWQPGMEVLVQDMNKKLDPKYKDPYPIHCVHTNGIVKLRRGHTFERINIRQIKIYHHRENP